jgi:chromosome segregation ATPase
VDLVDIKQGVCNVIPDYQQEIKQLKEALAKKTAACDTIEGRLAHKTRIINQQDAYIANLEEEKQVWSKTKVELQDKYSLLQEEFNMFRTLRQMIDTLSSTLAEERAAKRPRA